MGSETSSLKTPSSSGESRANLHFSIGAPKIAKRDGEACAELDRLLSSRSPAFVGLSVSGTSGSNPLSSSGESTANLTIHRFTALSSGRIGSARGFGRQPAPRTQKEAGNLAVGASPRCGPSGGCPPSLFLNRAPRSKPHVTARTSMR